MKAARPNPESKSRYTITRFDRVLLGYGAICGFLLVLYASGNPVLAIILGVPPGIFGFGIPMLVQKMFAPTHGTFAALPMHKQRRIAITCTVTIAALLGYWALIGDWFGFACTAMMAGAISLFFAHGYGYFRSFPASDRAR